jgi:non-ribosomal peptide synthetase component F
MAGPERAALAEHWRAECAGAAALELPPDRSRPVRPVLHGATHKLAVPPETAARVPEVARSLEVTPFALLLGTLAAALHQRSGVPEGLLGCSVTLRHGGGLRGTVGYLVNTIPVRAGFDAGTTLADAARDAHRRVLAGMRRARYPFSALVRELGPSRTAGRAPMLRVCVTHVGAGPLVPLSRLMPAAAPEGPLVEYGGLLLRQLDVPQMEGQFDLTVELRQGADGGLTVVLRHAAGLFEAATVEHFGRHFVRLVEAAVADPLTPAAKAPAARGDELRQLLAWGSGPV